VPSFVPEAVKIFLKISMLRMAPSGLEPVFSPRKSEGPASLLAAHRGRASSVALAIVGCRKQHMPVWTAPVVSLPSLLLLFFTLEQAVEGGQDLLPT